ncbi:MAG: DUF3332 family protein [Fibrobacteres bacterium]|nr:DUF3332 family protein [Fibrobacterota bacterium]
MSMAKRLLITLTLALALLSVTTSCYGKFSLTKKVYKWNGSLGNKFIETAVMWGFWVIPVYEVAGTVDLFVLNVIEFWTGSNPMTLKASDKEIQQVKMDDKDYIISATKNRMDIENKETGETVALFYNEAEKKLYYKAGDGSYLIAESRE